MLAATDFLTPWSTWPGELNALKALHSYGLSFPGLVAQNAWFAKLGARPVGRLVVGRVQEEYVDCDVEVEVVIAHEGGHAPTRQLLQHWHEFSAEGGV